MDFFGNFQNYRKISRLRKKREEKKRGRAPALRVIRAETRLTVYRSLPYQNNRKMKEQAAPHAGTLDHEKVVFGDDCFLKVLGNDILVVDHILKFI